MPIPEHVAWLRSHVGTAELWLPGVTAVVRRDDELLLVQRSDNGQWTPVTGILDPGEDPAVGAVREVLEETRVVARAERLVSTSVSRGVVHVNGDRSSYLDLCFLCTWVSGEAAVGDDESTAVGWFRIDALPAMREDLRRRVDDALAGEEAARFVR